MSRTARLDPLAGDTLPTPFPTRGAELPAGAQDAARRRRLLMIVRDYPPINTPGTLRALGFARYLPEFGWDTSAVTLRVGSNRAADSNAKRLAPEATNIYRAFGFDTKDIFSVFGRYPQVLALPDRNVSWLPAGVAQALRAMRKEGADALLSTGPPQTAHCIAHVVQRMTGLPWVADIRDLWDQPPAHARLSHSIERRLARRLLRACDRVTVVTREIADGLMHIYGIDVRDKLHILHNGFDEEAFDPVALDGGSERFTIAHIGYASEEYRNPRPFFAALRTCLDRGTLPADTVVSFLGANSDTLRSMSRAFGVEHLVRVRERVPYPEALREMCGASVLLLLQGEEFRHAVPTKAYEYLRSGRAIVALVAPDGESASLLRPFAGVFIASPDQSAAVAERLEAAHRAWRGAQTYERSDRQLAPYTRRFVASELAQILSGARAAKTADRGDRA